MGTQAQFPLEQPPALQRVFSPSELYMQVGDIIMLRVFSSTAAAVILVIGRVQLPDGTIVPFTQRFSTAGTRALETFSFNITEGYLLSCCATMDAASAQRGANYCSIQVRRGSTVAGAGYFYLAEGYLTGANSISWPGAVFDPATGGQGRLRAIVGTDPAAGVAVTETVPAGAIWRLLGVALNFATSATAANRYAEITLDDGTNVLARSFIDTAITASITQNLSWYIGAQKQFVIGVRANGSLPLDLRLLPGYRFIVTAFNFQVGDNFDSPRYAVEEWLVGA